MLEFPEDTESDWIPLVEFAMAHNIPRRTVSHYINTGKIRTSKVAANGYRYLHRLKSFEELKLFLPVKFGLVRNQRGTQEPSNGPSAAALGDTLEEAKLEAARLKNEILKLELESKLGKVVPRDVVESIETLYISRLKSLVLQFPGEISRKTGADEKLVGAIIEQGLSQFAVALEIKKKQWDEYYQGTLSKI